MIEPAPDSTPTLHLLGGLALRDAPDPAAAEQLLVQVKAVALLAYLALAAGPARGSRFHRRDLLVGLLWPELDQARARAALRKAVQTIRDAIGAGAITARGDEEIALTDGALVCDATAFADDVSAGYLTRALDRYAGDLLPGFHLPGCVEFGRWLEDRRAGLREHAAGASWALAVHFEQSARLTDAGRLARRAVRFAWDDERALRRALVLLDGLGDRAGALRLYDEFARRLRDDFEGVPSPATLDVVATLRAG